jgi:hypothetical protein
MSRKVLDLGEEARKANVMKLIANFHLGGCLVLSRSNLTQPRTLAAQLWMWAAAGLTPVWGALCRCTPPLSVYH